ncbi:uncharacterized protein BDZ99DRAFT_509602 [Mytilinidion resinicola]|uniref:C2H2-type domain-containing protein n=1 Tax=Mytilinidion resinicola TaxID=574789 RepID=A0A6A6YIC6_9PEZI|nr:uncharacterized protein BDZ99DRAFT_509602 [Mytilinidion resinicola]KAF2808308.1 hypothetical protein BDZ99DRAFT_509602 [Mytilinidion resinicola]
MSTCSCGRTFSSRSALGQHQKDTGHCHCKFCNRFFHTADGLKQHNLALHSWNCGHCNKTFSVQESLTCHQRATRHCHCSDCDRFFVDEPALRRHLRSSLHASQFHCCDCDRDFVDGQALQQHLENKIHSVTRRQTSDYVCSECDREFKTEQALGQHRSSLVHRPLSNIKCITSNGNSGCKRRFSSPSALLHHLESGACQSGVTRKTLNAAVQLNDTAAIITNPNPGLSSMLLETASQTSSNSGAYTPTTSSNVGVELTPSSTTRSPASPALLTPCSDHSTASSLTLFSFGKCPLCPPTRAAFSTPESLHQHLSSPAHAARIFHCPASLFTPLPSGRAVEIKSFSTLSGLAQHVESGTCGGSATLRRVAEYLEAKLKDLGIGKVKLLN